MVVKREKWIDISRAILIVFVVLGHYSQASHWNFNSPVDFVFLFHMPAFFIISGYLCKSMKGQSLKLFLVKKTKRFLVPYVSYLTFMSLCIFVYILLTKRFTSVITLKAILKTIYGGRYLNVNMGILWFLTCLYFIEVLWAFLDKCLQSNYLKITIVLFFYIFAHIQSEFFPNVNAPLGIDIGFIALTYYVFGYYMRSRLLDGKILLCSFIFTILFAIARLTGLTNYGLELAIHHYNNFLLDFFVPICISIVIFNISFYLSSFNNIFFENLGKTSLVIMCLHIFINSIFKLFFNYNIFIFTLIGVLIPYLIGIYILLKNEVLSKLFLGKQS